MTTKRQIYLDNNATTQPLPDVIEAMQGVYTSSFANASSAHSLGRASRARIVCARDAVSALVGALPEQVVFTSGGTEANNQVLLSCLGTGLEPVHIITSVVEHSSILETCKYLQSAGMAEITFLPVDSNGKVSLIDLKEAINDKTKIVSIQLVNNETGYIQDVAGIGEACQEAEVLFHVDIAQAAGKMAVDFSSMAVDFMTYTAHKIHGPQGVGAIAVRDIALLSPLLHGGSQELGLRPGTENLGGIVGFGKAAELRLEQFGEVVKNIAVYRDCFEKAVVGSDERIRVNGDVSQRICNTSNLLFSGIEGVALVAQLDARGIMCSQSSACTNQRPEPSYVLSKMGLSEADAYASVRFCFSQDNTLEEAEYAATVVCDIWNNLKESL